MCMCLHKSETYYRISASIILGKFLVWQIILVRGISWFQENKCTHHNNWLQDFPDGWGTNPQVGMPTYYLANARTAWKWKKLDREGGRPWRHPGSANGFMFLQFTQGNFLYWYLDLRCGWIFCMNIFFCGAFLTSEKMSSLQWDKGESVVFLYEGYYMYGIYLVQEAFVAFKSQ